MSNLFDLDNHIKKIPNFPKEGILFYDITSILTQPAVYQYIIDQIAARYSELEIDCVAALESRGFYFGSAAALTLKKPFYPIRKAGKLPGAVVKQDYALEYGTASIELQVDNNLKNKKILLIDDLIATGGTLEAAASLFTQQGAIVTEIFGVIGLPFLNYETKLKSFSITTLINYDKE